MVFMFTDHDITYKTISHMGILRNNNPTVNRCLGNMEKHGSLILFGGAVRDILVNQKPRDYDIVVAINQYKLEQIIEGIPVEYRKNRFGGFNICLDGHLFDIWSLESTWAFREKIVSASVRNLTETVFFNIDSVAVNLSTQQAYASKFVEALETNSLDIVLENNPYPDLCVLRALVFENRKGLKFSSKLRQYISEWINKTITPIHKLLEVQHKHYGFNALENGYLENAIYKYSY